MLVYLARFTTAIKVLVFRGQLTSPLTLEGVQLSQFEEIIITKGQVWQNLHEITDMAWSFLVLPLLLSHAVV